MKHIIRGVGAAAALLAMTAGNAMAFGPFTNTQVCGGTMFQTCATLSTTYVDNGDGSSTLTIDIANTSSNGDTFTAFGIRDVTATANTIDAALTEWSFSDDVNSLGGDPDGANPKYSGFASTGIGGGISNDGNTYTFSLTFATADLASLEFALHSQGGPNQCSTKLFIDGLEAEVNSVDPACGTTVVPEPITMTLLATGLAGMGGAGVIRRRKQA
jgi:hypothetical protein